MKPSALFRVSPKIVHHAWWIGLKNLKRSVIEVMGSRHRVVAAPGEGVTARDAHRTHPAAPQPAVALDRLIAVVRARRIVAAGRRQDPGNGQLITADQDQEQLGHGFIWASLSAASEASSLTSANETSSAAGRAITTTSYRIPTWSSAAPDPRI